MRADKQPLDLRPHAAASTAGASTRPIALMYHALGNDASEAAGHDAHYTVSAHRFAAQLALLRARCGRTVSFRDWIAGAEEDSSTVLTFDDGHLSDYTIAYPLLVEHGFGADFFVNPGRVGTPGYATWEQLREMSDAGLSIQSHSHRHSYLDELPTDALRDDLVRSRFAIENRIGRAVTLLAPPGGRMSADLSRVARQCGYRWILSSRPGRLRLLGEATDHAPIMSRMAVTAALADTTLAAWVDGAKWPMLHASLRYTALSAAKRALGNRGYERLRGRVIGAVRT